MKPNRNLLLVYWAALANEGTAAIAAPAAEAA